MNKENQQKYDVTHDADRQRFIIECEGRKSLVEYALKDDKLVITHTFVPEPLEGRGIASCLVRAACEYAVSNGLEPIATCSYAVAWINRNLDTLSDSKNSESC
ncbi:MAG: N-acetyltransferase [Bacteroides sp.]|nr:N-acetyltransferase [Bacteroides sp.]